MINLSPSHRGRPGIHVFFVSCVLLYFNMKFHKSKYQAVSFPIAVDVGVHKVCTNPGSTTNISCTVTKSPNASSVDLKYWQVHWRYENKVLPCLTKYPNVSAVSCPLTVYVQWVGERIFNCVVTAPDNRSQTQPNISKAIVILALDPLTEPDVLGVRFIQKENFHRLEVLWKTNHRRNVSYVLQYCINAVPDFDEFEPGSCPLYDSRRVKCFESEGNIYGIPRSTGFLCMGAFQALYFADYTFYIASERRGCQTRGISRHVNTKPFDESPEDGVPTLTVSTYHFVAVLIPTPVHFVLIVVNRPRSVNLEWTSSESRLFKLHYNCSSSLQLKVISTTQKQMILLSQDFMPYQPYDVCEFCISGRIYIGGKYSKPSCNVTRLAEESPSDGPIIRCFDGGCSFIVNGSHRDVKIAWKLPAKETWNGVLTRLIIKASYNDTENFEVVVSNVTADHAVVSLRSDWTYTLSMVACTRMGCGGIGNTIKVPPVFQLSKQQFREVSNMVTVAWILGCVVLAIIVIGLVVCLYRQKFKRSVALTGARSTLAGYTGRILLTGYRETEV